MKSAFDFVLIASRVVHCSKSVSFNGMTHFPNGFEAFLVKGASSYEYLTFHIAGNTLLQQVLSRDGFLNYPPLNSS